MNGMNRPVINDLDDSLLVEHDVQAFNVPVDEAIIQIKLNQP